MLYQGKQVVTFEDGIRKPLYEMEYSDTLLAILLRAANPSRYNPPKETINLLELEPDLLTAIQEANFPTDLTVGDHHPAT
jgi:hypothetical protein